MASSGSSVHQYTLLAVTHNPHNHKINIPSEFTAAKLLDAEGVGCLSFMQAVVFGVGGHVVCCTVDLVVLILQSHSHK